MLISEQLQQSWIELNGLSHFTRTRFFLCWKPSDLSVISLSVGRESTGLRDKTNNEILRVVCWFEMQNRSARWYTVDYNRLHSIILWCIPDDDIHNVSIVIQNKTLTFNNFFFYIYIFFFPPGAQYWYHDIFDVIKMRIHSCRSWHGTLLCIFYTLRTAEV